MSLPAGTSTLTLPPGRPPIARRSAGAESGAARPWAHGWPEIQAYLESRPRLLLGLGFDGVLAPTVARPADAAIPEEVRTALVKLAGHRRVVLTFFSGRALADLRSRVGLDGAYYVGNHGTELRGPGLVSSDGLASSCRSDLVDALAFLAKCTKRLAGVFVEDKGMTVSVHWRKVAANDVRALHEWMKHFVATRPRLAIVEGQASWDLRARASWDTANAVRQVLTRLEMKPADLLLIGQGGSDHSAFERLTGSLTLSVGPDESGAARYQMTDASQVGTLLLCILHTLRESSQRPP